MVVRIYVKFRTTHVERDNRSKDSSSSSSSIIVRLTVKLLNVKVDVDERSERFDQSWGYILLSFPPTLFSMLSFYLYVRCDEPRLYVHGSIFSLLFGSFRFCIWQYSFNPLPIFLYPFKQFPIAIRFWNWHIYSESACIKDQTALKRWLAGMR